MKFSPLIKGQSLLLITLLLGCIQRIYSHEELSSKLWHELGQVIDETNLDDFSGYAVATSQSGSIVAVGSPKHTSQFMNESNSNGGFLVGRVSVYKYSPLENKWHQIGNHIDGQAPGDQFGYSVSLNDEGKLLAVGAPQCDRNEERDVGCVTVYTLKEFTDPDGDDINGKTRQVWVKVGDTIVGEKAFDHFGTAINIQDTHNPIGDMKLYRIAIGAPDNDNQHQDSGAVYLYSSVLSGKVEDLKWNLEANITDYEPSPLAKFGSALSMTSDMKMIVVGAPFHGETKQGTVRIFYMDGENDGWTHYSLPDDLDVHKSGENCGSSVSVDPSGKFIAFGCPRASDEHGPNTGKVKFLRKETTSEETIIWHKSDINGQEQGNLFGTSVSLSQVMSGHVFAAIGAPKKALVGDDNQIIQNAGNVKVYYYLGEDKWEQAGLNVEGLDREDEFGSSVAISGDGHVVVGGAPNGGYVRTHLLEYTAPPTPAPTEDIYIESGSASSGSASSVWIAFMISSVSCMFIILSFVMFSSMRTSEQKNNKFESVRTSNNGEVV